MRSKWLAAIVVIAVAIVGCAKEERLTPVRGTLYIGDQPSTKGMGYVTFHPDASKGNTWQEEAVGPTVNAGQRETGVDQTRFDVRSFDRERHRWTAQRARNVGNDRLVRRQFGR